MQTTSHLMAQAPACAPGMNAPRTMLEKSATVRRRPGFIGEKAREKHSVHGKATAECRRHSVRFEPRGGACSRESVLILFEVLLLGRLHRGGRNRWIGFGGRIEESVEHGMNHELLRLHERGRAKVSGVGQKAVRRGVGRVHICGWQDGATLERQLSESGAPGTVVHGFLYLDTFNANSVSGDELAAIPYAYTIGR